MDHREHLLQAEIQSRNRVRDEYEHVARLTRRTEGWISGYSIKTKLRSSRDAATEKDAERNANSETEDQTAIQVIHRKIFARVVVMMPCARYASSSWRMEIALLI